MARRRLLCWATALATGAILATALAVSALARTGGHARALALCHIRMLRAAVFMYVEDTGSSPAEGLSPLDSPGMVATQVMARLYPLAEVRPVVPSGQRIYLSAYTDRLRILCLLDPWGRPYRMAVKVHPSGGGERGQATEIAVWSVGRNGVDEGGGGDDVVDPLWWPGPGGGE